MGTLNIFSVLIAVAGLLGVLGQGQDLTLQPGTAGTAVVRATVARIQEAGIFPSDNRLLRRIAYVETRDGVDILTYRDGYFGGIWQVDEDIFNKTQDVATYPELLETYQQVVNAFGVDWPTSTWADLRKPFFSALGARIYFTLISDPIPVAGDLQGQGEYWKSHYNRDQDETVQDFVDAVNEFEMEECPFRGVDLVFVLDSSASVGAVRFDRMKGFVGDVTNSFTIGADDTQVGVITFSGIARTIFDLNTYSNSGALIEAIGNILFMDDPGPSTHTADALNLLRVNAFTGEGGARDENLGIPRVAIVVTEGKSNINRSFTIPNAEAAHEAGIQIFAVGIGGNVNRNELEGIASDPLFVSQLPNFNIIEFQRILIYEACINVDATVSLQLPGLVDEADAATMICVSLSTSTVPSLNFDMEVNLIAINDTATMPDDFMPSDPFMVVFPRGTSAGNTTICVTIGVIDDNVLECNQDFTVAIASTSPMVMVGSPSTVTVTIEDNDDLSSMVVQFKQDMYDVQEDAGTTMVCVEVAALPTGGLECDIEVTLSATDGVKAILGEDYSVSDPLTATFTAGAAVGDTACAAITIINDDTLEFDHSFTVQLAGTDPHGVTISIPSFATVVNIHDDDDVQESSASPGQTPPVVTDEKGSLPLAVIGGAVGTAVVAIAVTAVVLTACACTAKRKRTSHADVNPDPAEEHVGCVVNEMIETEACEVICTHENKAYGKQGVFILSQNEAYGTTNVDDGEYENYDYPRVDSNY